MKLTPMMQQYTSLKTQYPGYLFFYRMGDFYELFGEDAITAHGILGITLTQRRSSKEIEGVPMCGVPYHAAEGYIAKLINAGKKVALCEQTETPEEAKKARGSSALVKRDVVRLYTGGTLTEDNLLPNDAARLLVALTGSGAKLGLAALDLATGSLTHQSLTPLTLAAELAALNPAELITTEQNLEKLAEILSPYPTTQGDAFTHKSPLVEEHLGQLTTTSKPEEQAVHTVLNYAAHTQKGKLPAISIHNGAKHLTYMTLDAATRTHLELTETFKGEKKGSLLWAIDRTTTNPGARLLRNWLTRPLMHKTAIEERLDAVSELRDALTTTHNLRDTLKHTTDIARALSRLALGRGSPRDLDSLRRTLNTLPELAQEASALTSPLLTQHSQALNGLEGVARTLGEALLTPDDGNALPALARDGGFIQQGYDADLDAAQNLRTNGLSLLQKLEQEEQTTAGIPLKLKYNKVWGYFLEVTKTHAEKAPKHFIHRQTTTNAIRFSTAELMTLERDFAAAETKALAREQELFEELVQHTVSHSTALLKAAEALATLDVLASHAILAAEEKYTRPTLTNGTEMDITAGRHPVVEHTVDQFIANDTDLTNSQLWLLTGPNMAGKSTYLRQVALITLLAHSGCFVPAQSATIGLTDRIFTRIGASDDLSKGQSTFMVEMAETAEILNHATSKSLVVLDEIGRGTATYDGMAIAWAVVDYLARKTQARGLFATHYHELTHLAEQLPNVNIYHVSAKEWTDEHGKTDIIFQHDVKPGAAPRSYGIHVAKLAGLPKAAVTKAEKVLAGLEQTGGGKTSVARMEDIPLFAHAFHTDAAETVSATASSFPSRSPLSETEDTVESVKNTNAQDTEKQQEINNKLLKIDLNDMSPREAQNLLYDLQILASMA